MTAYLYSDNVSPRDRFDRLELQLDNGSTAIIRRGVAYDLSANEVARARPFAVMAPVGSATGTPQVIVELPVVGTPQQGDVPIWSTALGAFTPGEVTGIGGGTVVEGQLSDSRLISEALENESKVVGAIPVTFYGAPGDGSIFYWPDGTYGTWRPTSDGIYTLNSIDHIDGFTVTYRPLTPTPNDRITWRAQSSSFTPSSDAAAATLVTHVPEVRSENTARNAYLPSDSELATFHAQVATANATDAQNPYLAYVTGRSGLTAPSTDDLIQWCSHKWGIPTDWVRAQMALESRWSMDFLGDKTTEPDSSYVDAAPAYARAGGLAVYESLGISQLRWYPDKSGNLNPHPGTDPLRWQSTAFNLDVYGATVRAFYDDPGGWRTAWGDGYSSTESNHQWLSIGGWFQPYPWGNSGQLGYIANVQARLAPNIQPWQIADWTNVADDVKLIRQPTWARGTFGAVGNRPVPVIEVWVPPTAPGAVTGLTVTPGDTTLALNWTPPTDNGGSPLTGYRITEVNEGWTVDTGGIPGLPFTLTGLTNGHSQTFTVAAYNAIGYGAESNQASGTPAPASVPGIPTSVVATASVASAHLVWTAPASNGGSAITGYRVTPYIGATAQTPINTGSSSPSFNVTGLTNGTAYTFTVAAINAIGTGTDSVASNSVTPFSSGFTVPAQMPLVSTGLRALASSETLPNNAAGKAVDTHLNTLWRSVGKPTTGSPATLALDLRTVANANKNPAWVVFRHYGQPRYTSPSWVTAPLGTDPASPYTALSRNFKLRSHAGVTESHGTAPAALVQSIGAHRGSSGTSQAAAFGSNVQAGTATKLVCGTAWSTAAGTATITDSQGNTWVPIDKSLVNDATVAASIQWFECSTQTAGALTVTATVPTSNQQDIWLYEVSGVGAVDIAATGNNVSGNSSVVVNLAYASEMVIVASINLGPSSPPTGYTQHAIGSGTFQKSWTKDTLPGAGSLTLTETGGAGGVMSVVSFVPPAQVGGALPSDADSGWVDLQTITDNRRAELVYGALNLSGKAWLQIRITDSNGVSGNDNIWLDMEIYDASAGSTDTWISYGDSITMETRSLGVPDGSGDEWADGGIDAHVATLTGRAKPLAVDYSTGGWTADIGDSFKSEYLGGALATAVIKNAFLCFGHNDAHAPNADISSAGTSGSFAVNYKNKMQSIIDYLVTNGIVRVVIPYITYTTNGSYDEPNTVVFNQVIDQLAAANPTVVQIGPDFHSFYQSNPTELRDGIHPTIPTGYNDHHTLWAEWLQANVYT